ncbi:MAG: hypothetical protein GEV10_21195 [Streptosporangiales bacterium]|nr:hypothetical protein [Streptosporangiales bacterium]
MATSGSDSGDENEQTGDENEQTGDEKKQTTRRRTRTRDSGDDSADGTDERRRRTRSRTATEIAREASRQLAELTGRKPEAVTALSRTDDGWSVDFDVVEIRRVPETADVIGVYRAELDENAELLSYRRIERFVRSQTREG